MSIHSSFRISAAAGLLGASLMLATSGAALAIPHDGVTFGNSAGSFNVGGVFFSSFHRANGNPAAGGGLDLPIAPGTDIHYTWETDGPVGPGSRQLFDRGSSTIATDGDFTIDLWTNNIFGSAADSIANDVNVLATRRLTGAGTNPPPGGAGPFLGFTLTELVDAQFEFTIADAATGASIYDILRFDSFKDMGPVDAIGNNAAGDVGTFLWGFTAGYDALDPFGGTSSTQCITGSAEQCESILTAFYGSKGVGIDLAYSGTPVAEPGTFALLGAALLGFGALRRRRLVS